MWVVVDVEEVLSVPKLKPHIEETSSTVDLAVVPILADVGRFTQQKTAFRRIFGTIAAVWTVALGIFALGTLEFGGFLIPMLCIFGSIGYVGALFLGATYWKTRITALMDFPDVETERDRVRPGDAVEVRYSHRFKQDTTIEALQIQLIMREWVRYRRGTSTYTDTHDRVMGESVYQMERVMAGQTYGRLATLSVPSDAMHSWSANDNRISWHIKVDVDLPGWIGDYTETYSITVLAEGNDDA